MESPRKDRVESEFGPNASAGAFHDNFGGLGGDPAVGEKFRLLERNIFENKYLLRRPLIGAGRPRQTEAGLAS